MVHLEELEELCLTSNFFATFPEIIMKVSSLKKVRVKDSAKGTSGPVKRTLLPRRQRFRHIFGAFAMKISGGVVSSNVRIVSRSEYSQVTT